MDNEGYDNTMDNEGDDNTQLMQIIEENIKDAISKSRDNHDFYFGVWHYHTYDDFKQVHSGNPNLETASLLYTLPRNEIETILTKLNIFN